MENLRYSHCESTFGTLYKELRAYSKFALLYNVVYMVRRLAFVLIALALPKYPFAQAMLVILSSILVLIYVILARPFSIQSLNRLEYFNELCILIASYHLLIYTDFDFSSPHDSVELHLQIQYKAGWSMIAITSVNIIANMIVIMVETVGNLRLAFIKARYHIRRYLYNKQRAKKYEAKASFNETHTPLQLKVPQMQ